jgi:hypothetical protein
MVQVPLLEFATGAGWTQARQGWHVKSGAFAEKSSKI